MKHSFSLLGVVSALSLIAGLVEAQDPSFDLTLSAPASVAGNPGSIAAIDVVGQLTTNGLSEADPGAQGWSISISTGDCVAASATTLGTIAADVADGGLRITGFEKSEVVDPTKNDGGNGVVSAVVLSFTMPVTAPAVGTSDVLILSVEATIPNEGETGSCDLTYEDGLIGSGQPVDNKVTYTGQTKNPSLGSASVELQVVVDCAVEGVALSLAYTADAIGQSGDPLDPARTSDVTVSGSVGETASGSAYVAIASQLDGGGVQGWSLAISADNALVLTGATTDGTVGADVNGDPPGIRNTGFEKTELVDPDITRTDTRLPQGQGAVSAVVCSFTMPITLEPRGLATVLALTFDSAAPVAEGGATGAIFPNDGLAGSGQPVNNVATVGGSTQTFCALDQQVLSVLIEPVQIANAINGDGNGDGRVDIADPIHLINALFRSGPASPCAPAADANDDGMLDLSDASFTIQYLFFAGEAPSGIGDGCSQLADASVDNCPAGSTACP